MGSIRVQLEQSGGFGGLRLPPRTLDTADMTPEAARELAELVDAAERAPQRTSGRRRVPDAMRYDLTITREGQVRSRSFDDTTVPPEVRPLLQRVASEGRPR